MARLSDSKQQPLAKIRRGAYMRCFGNVELSSLLSRVQSLISRNGRELENIIAERVQSRLINDLDDFLSADIMTIGVQVAPKKVIRKSNTIVKHTTTPDFLVFERVDQIQRCYIFEVKDGHEYDTKASAKEHSDLTGFLSKNATSTLESFESYVRLCGFNSSSKQEIYTGFKEKFSLEQIFTGKEFCTLLSIDYEDIRAMRASDRDANFPQFLDDLLVIDSVREYLEDRLNP